MQSNRGGHIDVNVCIDSKIFINCFPELATVPGAEDTILEKANFASMAL